MGFLKNLFTPGKLSKPIDMSVVNTDMHSHLIPGIDDGSDSLETSIRLITGMMELGYKKFITTPHIQGEFYQNTPHTILSGLERVRRELKKQNIQAEIDAAAEYLIDDQFEAKYKEGELLTFGKKHLLIELSYFNEHPRLKEFLFDLQIDGYKIILAHPERYAYWFNNFKKYEELKDRGIFFQLNITSLTGYYSADVKKMAEKFVNENMIDFAGSDMHNFNYLDALTRTCSEKYLSKLVDSGKLMNSTL
jgi:tyrosine-protein phosphatase YwqE